ncbi:MAG: DUF2085 domain-containing protein [Chloroflexota bacterium]
MAGKSETKTAGRTRSFAVRANIWLLRLSRRWLRVALILLGIYITLPFVAPTLMRIGAEGPARIIYTLYSPFCHQFAFRTLFLYGEQPFYPRSIVGSELKPFEEYITGSPAFEAALEPFANPETIDVYGFSPALQFASRAFVGDERMGYKMTLCARDIAIYTAMFTGGLIYSIPRVRRRLRPAPIWLYLILGIAPIGIDGFSQLLSYPPFNLWPPRETSLYFRVGTGICFGLMNVWLGFPYLELSMQDTRRQLEAKLSRAGISV